MSAWCSARAPGFALAAIATLALGVGANIAIFRVVDTLLIEPLPCHATPDVDESTAPQADYRAITPELFEVMGIGRIEGRAFTGADDQTGAPVVIVNQRLAARMWPGRSAIGERLAIDPAVTGHPSAWAAIVDVVRHLRHRSPSRSSRLLPAAAESAQSIRRRGAVDEPSRRAADRLIAKFAIGGPCGTK